MQASKKSAEGRQERTAFLESWIGKDVIERALSAVSRTRAQHDDVLDALVALWTAERISRGIAKTVPSVPPRDSVGLRMEIVY